MATDNRTRSSNAGHRNSNRNSTRSSNSSSNRYSNGRPTSSNGNYTDYPDDNGYDDQSSAKRRSANTAKDSRGSRKSREKKKRGKIILFIAEIFVLTIMLVFLYTVLKVEQTGKINIPEEDIVINQTVKEYAATNMKGYRNVALFGVDSTSGQLTKGTRSDSIMIASVNQDTGECRLVSVYRDTYLNRGNDTYNKCNSAYANGGAEQAINMLNMNLDLNITDFVTVGFKGVTDTVNALGGVMIDVDQAELQHINSYQRTMADELNYEYVEVTNTGYQRLNGLQATAYCRIRYTAGDDFRRAERQREVLMAILVEAKSATPAELNQIASDIFGSISTSLDLDEIISLLSDIAQYEVTDNGGFPEESMRATGVIGKSGSCVVPVDLEQNVIWLHEFLFGVQNYVPSEEVKQYSQKIKSDTEQYINR